MGSKLHYTNNKCRQHNSFLYSQNSQQTSPVKEVFQKKPLGRRRHLMSKSARSGICEFSTATSGTERERGFIGRLPCQGEPRESLIQTSLNLLFINSKKDDISLYEIYHLFSKQYYQFISLSYFYNPFPHFYQ